MASAFRLRGEEDGQPVSFALRAGDNAVGSASSAEVRLSTRGVSRLHAVVRVDEGGVLVRDSGSKNGTFVNGEVVVDEGSRASAGDELCFGPVALRLEPVDPEDAELAWSLDAPGLSASVTGGEPTTLLSRSVGGPIERARLHSIEAFVDRLGAGPEPDWEGALAVWARAAGARGAALVEWDERGAAVIAASWGITGVVPTRRGLSDLPRSRRSGCAYLRDGPSKTCGAIRDPGGEALGLWLWGVEAAEALEPMMGTLLAVARCFHARASTFPGAQSLSSPTPRPLRFPDGILRGESAAMVSLYRQMELLLQGDLPVLILGETGVGKEHLAHTLHLSSSRGDQPFVAINCAALPAELLESELFGIGKGVATGVTARAGKFLEAQGGTLFLDEVGEMSAALQAKLLRALEEKEIQPLGRPAVAVDVRVVAATNRDLRAAMDDGRFREDLYYRLAGYVLEIPALREREEDLARLIGFFLRQFCVETGKSIRGLTTKALRSLTTYPWPGNIRELKHVARRLVYLCPQGQAVDSEMLPPTIRGAIEGPIERPPIDDTDLHMEKHVEALERELIRRALTRTAGNRTRAAKLLRLSRNGLGNRLARFGIDAEDFVP